MENLKSKVLKFEKAPMMLVYFEHKFGYEEMNVCQRKAPGLHKRATYSVTNANGKITNLVAGVRRDNKSL